MRQIRVDRCGHQGERDDRGDEEPAVDRAHPAAVGPARSHSEDSDHRRHYADRGNDQREGEPGVAEGGLAEDQRGDQRDGVRLEEVGGHTGTVAHVVAHVVGDGRGITRIILRNALFDLADQVGADVGGLGEDAAADTHEHRDERRAEAKSFEDLGRVGRVDQHDTGGAEQTQPHREHADYATRAKSDLHGLVRDGGEILFRLAFRRSGFSGRGGDAHIAAHREPHSDVSGGSREHRADQEEDRTPGSLIPIVRGQQHEQEEHHDGEYREGPQLPSEIGIRAFLDRCRDLLHAVGALACRQYLAYEHCGHHEGGERDDPDHHDDEPVVVGQDRGCEG